MAGLTPAGASFCRFYDRCPHAMPVCVEQAPPLFRTAPDRGTATHPYQAAPTISAEELAKMVGGDEGGKGTEVAAALKADECPRAGTFLAPELWGRQSGGEPLPRMLRSEDRKS